MATNINSSKQTHGAPTQQLTAKHLFGTFFFSFERLKSNYRFINPEFNIILHQYVSNNL